MIITLGDSQLDLDQKPAVMSIINVTPDSFYAQSRTFDTQSVSESIEVAIAQGADILDIGGYSSRPGADDVGESEEVRRLSLGMETARAAGDILVSVDTFRPSVVEQIYERFGAFIVNDITGGSEQMFDVVAKYSLPYICMHSKGTPQTMQSMTHYNDLEGEVESFFGQRIKTMQGKGIEQIILDLGFGFAKTLEQNYQLFASMERFNKLNCPMLVGISRKSMIYKPLGTEPEHSLTGTTILNWTALSRGAKILRVHDTAQAVQTISMYSQFKDYLI
ncbi:MAG: dihydropteroate synthase [Rikenellaceae bacterium]